jgi:hypothetical protein
MSLPEEVCAFFFCAMAQLEPDQRPVFAERVGAILGAYSPFCEPEPGDVDRAIRSALAGLWVPPPSAENPSRWNQAQPKFERISKRAV